MDWPTCEWPGLKHCEWPGCEEASLTLREGTAKPFLPARQSDLLAQRRRILLVLCSRHFDAARESERLFYPPLAPLPLDAEGFYWKEQGKYPADADGRRRLAKRAGQQGFNLEKDSESFRREMHLFTGTAPYSRRVSPVGKLTFLAMNVFVRGERTDVIVQADFLTDPTNDYELRKWVEELTGDPALVQKWSEEAEGVRNLRLSFRRASKGAPDQGRPAGGSPRLRRPDVVASNTEYFKRRVAAEKKAGERRRGLDKRILEEMAREKQPPLKVETIKRRLYR
jgi:hypothetical protein